VRRDPFELEVSVTWRATRQGGKLIIHRGALTAAADQPTGLVVVARPDDDAAIAVEGGLPTDELHVTLGYFGDAADVSGDTIDALRTWVHTVGDLDITASVGGVARMGDDDPQAVTLLIEAAELAELRADLESAAEPDRTHPHFTPHITLGYGIDMPDDIPKEVHLSRVELWAAGERYTGDDANAVE
jgi:hypothetical protein